eukprot:CAMPEP_0114695632 /NCGR_PEP_ID=MMETSP0191-20121206/71572_1 /TAXON_ID=126664 /ORGANISM="Sorites sp." /LENGTH=131 /DNA_ID=CAMNT_0001992109 /DNA_START=132 /DNA_END=527 /DNA_ORIENTATION=+
MTWNTPMERRDICKAAGQVHGCFFKQLDPAALQHQLVRWQVPVVAMMEIQRLIKEGKHYQLACIEYFKSIHPQSDGEGVGNSPMDFFRTSCRYHKDQAKGGSPIKDAEMSQAKSESPVKDAESPPQAVTEG